MLDKSLQAASLILLGRCKIQLLLSSPFNRLGKISRLQQHPRVNKSHSPGSAGEFAGYNLIVARCPEGLPFVLAH